MTLLLDGNALLWLIWGSSSLGSHARAQMASEPELVVSDVTVFEISLKAARRKLHVPTGLAELVEQLGIARTGIRDDCLDAMRELPPHHRDPFDRYLIAQSLVDSVPVVTSDPVFGQYGVQVVDART